MATDRTIRNSEDVAELVRRLARCPHVSRFDEGRDTAASSLAYCFDSLEDHFREFLNNQLPRLAKAELTDQQVCDLLHDIGTIFGQILWHIRLPKFYHYLEEEKNILPRKK